MWDMYPHQHGRLRFFSVMTLQSERKFNMVTRTEDENLLTYIPPESVVRAGYDDDACATVWWRRGAACPSRSRVASACGVCRRLASRTWTLTPPVNPTSQPHIHHHRHRHFWLAYRRSCPTASRMAASEAKLRWPSQSMRACGTRGHQEDCIYSSNPRTIRWSLPIIR